MGSKSLPGDVKADPGTARYVIALCFLIVMVDGFDTVLPAFTAPSIRQTFDLAFGHIGALFASGYLGAIAGSLIAGQLVDLIGRRAILMLFLAIAGVCTIISGTASSFEFLLTVRFITGAGIGGSMPSLISLAAEHSPKVSRATLVTTMYIGFPAGAVVGGVLTSFFLDHGWRPVFWGAGIVTLCAVIVALFIPETLGKSGEESVKRDIHSIKDIFSVVIDQFAEGRLLPALLLWLGLFSTMLITHLLTSWTPSLAVRMGVDHAIAALTGSVLSSGAVVGALFARKLIFRTGPFLAAGSLLGASVFLVILLGQALGSLQGMLVVLFLVGTTALAGQLISPAMTVEIFPPHVRGTGTGWTMAVGRLGSIAGPLTGAFLLSTHLSPGMMFVIISGFSAVAAVSFLLAGKLRPKETA